MKADRSLDRDVSTAFSEAAPSREPDGLYESIIDTTSHMRPRPRWLASLKEPPMRYRSHVAFGSPATRVAALAAATLLVAILGAGALVAGAQSIAPAPEEVDAAVPGAAWVTGSARGGTGGLVGSAETVMEGVTRSRYHRPDMRITMSDPRLSGTLDVIYNQDVHSGATGDLGEFLVGSGTYRIVNDGGVWEGPNVFLNQRSSGTATVSDTGVLAGSGAYEGLSAFLVFDFKQSPVAVVGAIFSGGLPPVATFE